MLWMIGILWGIAIPLFIVWGLYVKDDEKGKDWGDDIYGI